MLLVSASIRVCLAAVAGLAAPDPQSVDLKPRFTAGREDRFIVEMISKSDAKFVDSPVTRPESYKQKFRIKRRIAEAGEGGARIELVYEAVELAIAAGAKSLAYDSESVNDSESELTLGPMVTPALNKPIIVEVDSLGRFKKVTGNQNKPGAPPSLSLLGDEMFTQLLTPLYGSGCTAESAKVGETWTELRRAPSSQTGVITTTRNYTVAEAKDAAAAITIAGTLALEPSEKAAAARMRIDEQSVSGRFSWDTRAGSLRDYSYNQHMKLLAETDGKQRMAVTDYTVTMKWLEVWPPAATDPKEQPGAK